MLEAEKLITENLEIWSSAVKTKSAAGRGNGNKLEHYGIKKLRELILELAVRGLLVPQVLTDEPASELLKVVEGERAKLAKEGKIKKQKTLPRIEEHEKTFDLPPNWEWVKLGSLMEMFNGRSFKQSEWSDSGVPIVRIQNLNDPTAPYNMFSGELAEQNKIDTGTFLISWSGTPGTSFGAFVWDRGPAALNQHINKCVIFGKNSNFEYLRLAVNSCMDHLIANAQGGVGLKHVTKGTLNNTIFGLPPLAEQTRIVTKVDELMALCDQLEQQQETSITAHQTLVKTLLDALTSASEREGFTAAWARIAEHFDTLFTTEWSIDQLKQTILQLAVMGKLVPQDPNDEPASELLKKIIAEKAQLVKGGKVKKQKPLPDLEDEEMPFELPNGWEWVKLQEVTSKITDGDHKTPPRIESGRRLLSAKNVRDGFLETENCDFISEESYEKSRERCLPEEGDLLIVSVGGTIGRSALVPSDSEFALVRSVALVKPLRIASRYLKYSMDSNLLQNSIHSRKRGGAQPCLYLSEISNFPFSVPPLEEQNRIIAKVDKLMAICAFLKSQIGMANTTQLRLTDAIVCKVVA